MRWWNDDKISPSTKASFRARVRKCSQLSTFAFLLPLSLAGSDPVDLLVEFAGELGSSSGCSL